MSLEISREGRIARIALNRPEKRNALSVELCQALVGAIHDAEADDAIGVILLEARGKVFCAGMDLDEILQPDTAEKAAIHEELFTFGAKMAKPVVAAVQGPALGGGIGLIANCHVVVAAQGCTFALSEIRLGMWPFAIFRTVALAMGERRAVELSLTGRVFGTNEALQYGLVHHVVPPVELDDRATALAETIAAFSPEAIRRGMAFVRESRGLEWSSAGALAKAAREEAFRSADFNEGVRAFKEKRTPRWPSAE
jgi:enoyl-CoA hydratase/carnithine racemase